ncbi:cyclohexanone monooxygenase [Sphingomonas sp. PP-F2F-A104-K0414]|uniref:flavin-containing monooxygenase n=1 Tax=Sphingomonas sp. PP-F2F-A104-K0414 TaxID=2135661 RepID=UPI00105357B3|nr:NAD(P)/FAD-dependent oxidoreductase [Sphingomonas sp. PP-F2F-A104-K0414]TCP95869.1 cyclohexanone monooxygenase [Sphingomonas sp. PP-F2F-A104-K0414]
MSTIALSPSRTSHCDVAIIGGGFAGIYAVHKFRDLMGLSVQAFEAGRGVGGTWYWNRYPGARCDFESIYYSYSFSEELQQEWVWKERFAGQPEILSYLEYVADKFDVRRSFKFETRVTAVVWNEDEARWHLTADDGSVTVAQFVISGAGGLSLPKTDEFPGAEQFKGRIIMTSRWPHEGVDLKGQRVAVIGTGASGTQAIPIIAKDAMQLTVFQRTANFTAPLRNRPFTIEEMDEVRGKYQELRIASRKNFSGVPYKDALPSTFGVSEAERVALYKECFEAGGFRMLISTFQDLLFDPAANEAAGQFIREQIASRIDDPEKAKILVPTTHSYGTKRPPFETNYFEAFNQDNVDIVDLRSDPIVSFTQAGIKTASREFEFDVIVLATGFDAVTGPLLNMGIVGRNGLKLTERWVDGPHTYLGLVSDGFPNLFMITGPQSATALYNNPLAIEDHIDWSGRLIAFMREEGLDVADVTPAAVEKWGSVCNELYDHSLYSKNDSWYNGSNIAGKPKVCMMYVGGAPTYRQICDDEGDAGYPNFLTEARPEPVEAARASGMGRGA